MTTDLDYEHTHLSGSDRTVKILKFCLSQFKVFLVIFLPSTLPCKMVLPGFILSHHMSKPFDFPLNDDLQQRVVVPNELSNSPVYLRIGITSRIRVEGKSSVCAISIKYRIIILIIIIISLGQIFFIVYCKHITHARTHAHTHVLTHTAVAAVTAVQTISIRWRPTVMARSTGDNAGHGHSNKHTCWRIDFPEVLDIFRV